MGSPSPGRAAGILTLALLAAAASGSCGRGQERDAAKGTPVRPSILLVTLDTTRADAIGPGAAGIETPAYDALAARGRRFLRAYATAPETLPAHASMMSGLYPAGHGIHENARSLAAATPLLAERLQAAGYGTGAFVSAFVLARRFGLARGFEVYDDSWPPGHTERTARETTDRALAYLSEKRDGPVFLWVHYYDPHAPYDPPEPYRARYREHPYLGEVAAMDEQLGRLARAFEERVRGPVALVVAGDHGEGLGDHGEEQHGRLLYDATMRVPLLVCGPGIAPGSSGAPVSTRRVFHTVLGWAGLPARDSLVDPGTEIVLGEAMKPFLAYGWQPQVMAVEGRKKAILAGRLEAYDLDSDPGEGHDLGLGASLSRAQRTALLDYPPPPLGPPRAKEALSEEERRKLASLGYVSAGSRPLVRKDAPRPVDMVRLFGALDEASTLFVREEYARAIPLLERILRDDPGNLDAALRLATAHSSLGHEGQALSAFRKAEELSPQSADVRTYLALHYARGREWERAAPLLERVLAETPDRLPALEALAVIRERQKRIAEAVDLRLEVYALRDATSAEWVSLGELAMGMGRTEPALEAFEKARARQGAAFIHDLELGVLYLAARRFPEARDALDRVPASHPAYPMVLFKRAQVSVLLGEPDRGERIARAREKADASTRELIARERLFLESASR